MQYFHSVNLSTLFETSVSLSVAFILGSLIGIERQIRQRTAGLRTNALVCVGAALFVDLALRFHQLYGGTPSPLQVVAYVVSGVGFLGAGVIMREEGNVRGINTAATLWGSAAVGCAAGAGLLAEAVLGMLFVLAGNTLLRPVVNRIDRQPIDTEAVEVTYTFYLVTRQAQRKQALVILEQQFEEAHIPLRDIKVHTFGAEEIEFEAVLLPTSIDGDELDILAERMRKIPYVSQAFWSPSTTD